MYVIFKSVNTTTLRGNHIHIAILLANFVVIHAINLFDELKSGNFFV